MRQFTQRELFEMRLRSRRMMFPGFIKHPSTIVVVAGSQTFSSVGIFSFTVPYFNTLSVDVRGSGSGGGGAGAQGLAGGTGSPGSFARFFLSGWCDVLGNGAGGGGGGTGGGADGGAGSPGTASGGDSNTTGGGSSGGTAGSGMFTVGKETGGPSTGGNGAAGGRAVKTFTPAQLPFLANVTVTVPAGGAAGANVNDSTTFATPTGGFNGTVAVTWS